MPCRNEVDYFCPNIVASLDLLIFHEYVKKATTVSSYCDIKVANTTSCFHHPQTSLDPKGVIILDS